jgi:hypothetical protein
VWRWEDNIKNRNHNNGMKNLELIDFLRIGSGGGL